MKNAIYWVFSHFSITQNFKYKCVFALYSVNQNISFDLSNSKMLTEISHPLGVGKRNKIAITLAVCKYLASKEERSRNQSSK